MKSLPPSSVLAAFGLVLSIVVLAGFVDAYSFVQFQKLFVSFMSGNTTSLGVAAAKSDSEKLPQLPLVLGLFVGGVGLGTLLHHWAGRWSAALILGLVAGLLGLAYARPALAVTGLTLGMGLLNASVHEVGGVKVSLTFVTGTLVKFGAGLANLVSGRQESWEWLWQIALWGAFLAGAFAGGVAVLRLHESALLVAAGLSLVLAAAASLVHGLRQGPPTA
ncbi:MAG: DUF1275 domain-containing protein [Cytophagaceae bacterium]|nr:MAG: DUF1275 domain-containing protein [Cytophagaceae bacterium]